VKKRQISVQLLLVVVLLAPLVAVPRAQPVAPLERHKFVIRDFHTESGVTFPEARVVYPTLGTLNAAGDNAVLLPSHYMANFNGYNWLVRGGAPDRALEPARDFLILTELFGNGRSSSPSNTPEPFHGPRFPVMTIRDNVEAVHWLVTQELHVRHLRAVVGFSMGAEQAFQWAISYPTFMDAIVATSETAKCYGLGFVRLEGQIAALTTDPAWQQVLI
jgi:homoserine O-acetyltransferase/O-succinyltransferase